MEETSEKEKAREWREREERRPWEEVKKSSALMEKETLERPCPCWEVGGWVQAVGRAPRLKADRINAYFLNAFRVRREGVS
jgi:hypothetical protein